MIVILHVSIHQSVHPIVTLLKIVLLYYENPHPYQKIFHRYVVNVEVNASVQLVQKLSVVKIQLFKSIEQAIQIFPDNVVINLIALRVGELKGNIYNNKR